MNALRAFKDLHPNEETYGMVYLVFCKFEKYPPNMYLLSYSLYDVCHASFFSLILSLSVCVSLLSHFSTFLRIHTINVPEIW